MICERCAVIDLCFNMTWHELIQSPIILSNQFRKEAEQVRSWAWLGQVVFQSKCCIDVSWVPHTRHRLPCAQFWPRGSRPRGQTRAHCRVFWANPLQHDFHRRIDCTPDQSKLDKCKCLREPNLSSLRSGKSRSSRGASWEGFQRWLGSLRGRCSARPVS